MCGYMSFRNRSGKIETIFKVKGYNNTTRNMKSHAAAGSGSNGWKPPDGGYGWVIVFAAFLIYIDFNCYSQLGIFMLELADHFSVSNEAMGWMHATQTVCGRVLGILIGPLTVHIGVRWTAFCGCFLIALGYFSSSFVTSFGLMYLTYGIIIGIGCGFLFCTPTVAVQQYFRKRTSIAIGLAMVGYNIGILMWPPFATWLKSLVGWKKTFLIESGIHATIGLICTVLLRPPGHTDNFCGRFTETDQSKASFQENHATNSSVNPKLSHNDFPPKKKHWILRIIDPSPLTMPLYILYLICLFLMAIGVMTNFVYIPVRSEMMGIGGEKAALQLTVYGCVGLVTIPLFAGIGNLPGVRRDIMFPVGLLLAGSTILVSTTFDTFPLLVLHATLFSIFSSVFFSVMMTLMVDIVGVEKTAVAAGWFAFVFGLAQAVVHPVAGYTLDKTGDPQYPFLIGGSCTLCGGVLACFIPILRKRAERQISDVHNHLQGDTSRVKHIQQEDISQSELVQNNNEFNKSQNGVAESIHM